jgi:hypothetical protein
MLLEILEIFICLFAVYGMYAFLCRILALFMGKDALSIAFHVREEEEPIICADGARQAEILSESMNGRLMPPVMLLDGKVSEETALTLRDLGLAVYVRKK